MFLVYLLPLAMGIDLGCSPGGFGFYAGDFFASGGLSAGLLLLSRRDGASSFSGKSAVMSLEITPLLPLLVRLLRFVQRFTSTLDGLRWWLMQLNQGLESVDGGSGGVGVDQLDDERKKMNRISRDFLVIFYFFLDLVVKGGCIVLHINISSLIAKKRGLNELKDNRHVVTFSTS